MRTDPDPCKELGCRFLAAPIKECEGCPFRWQRKGGEERERREEIDRRERERTEVGMVPLPRRTGGSPRERSMEETTVEVISCDWCKREAGKDSGETENWWKLDEAQPKHTYVRCGIGEREDGCWVCDSCMAFVVRKRYEKENAKAAEEWERWKREKWPANHAARLDLM